MKITAVEQLMYEIMMSIYESGIPIDFKGSMVLKACLMEYGYSEETRHTIDIDANWQSETAPTAEQMTESLQNAVSKVSSALGVKMYRMYSEGRSAGFEIADLNTGEILFTMDVDVNRPAAQTKMYEINGLNFRGVSPLQMIADKISSISSEKLFRRIKDVVDLYYISKVFDLDKNGVLQTLKNSERDLGDFCDFLNKEDDMRQAYEKFRFSGNIKKASFDEVYQDVKNFIRNIMPVEE